MNYSKLKILSHLRKNNREKLTSLSRKTQIPVSTIFESLKNNFNEHIIKHTCIIDFNKIGFNIKASILIKFKPGNKVNAINYLSNNLFVNSLSKINNGYDVIVEVICKDMNVLEEFIEQIENNTQIKKKEVYYIMQEIKKEDFFSNPSIIESLIEYNAYT